MKNFCSSSFFVLGSSLIILFVCGIESSQSAECAGKTVAQCADALASKIDELQQENLALTKKIIEHEEVDEARAKKVSEQLAELSSRLDRTQKQIAAIYQALSFGYGTRKAGVIYNGPDDGDPAAPHCPAGSVMTGVRHSGFNFETGEIDCISLKPVDFP